MITKDEDENTVPESDRKWCLCIDKMGSPMTLCTGEVFGAGEGAAEGDIKIVKRGGITCLSCLAEIRHMKSIRL